MTATTMLGLTSCIPRFATPRNEDFPTLGPQVGEIARRLGKPLMPWQQAAADVAYEYDPDSGLFRYDEANITVPRQSGKTTITLAKKVHRLTVLARQWGPQRSTYTAQTRLAARKKLERDFAETLRSSRAFREVPNAKARPTKGTEWRLSLNNGSEAIQFGAGSFLQIDAPKRTSGHGDTLDDGTIDEAFAHEDDTVEAAMRPAMATRRNAQLWVISTAGDGRSKYLWRKVLAGRRAAETGEHGRVCYIEYSAPEDADPGDPATWWGCMPALGHTITEDFVRGEWDRAQRKGPEGVDSFLRAYLNLWPDVPILDDTGTSVLPAWPSLAVHDDQRPNAPVFAVETTLDQAWTAIGLAGPRSDLRSQVELVDYRPGSTWAVQRLVEIRDGHDGKPGIGAFPVVIDPREPAGALIAELERQGFTVIRPSSQDVAHACASFFNATTDGSVVHIGQPDLDESVKVARQRPLSDAWSWDRKGRNVAALFAVTLALWGSNRDTGGGWMVSIP